MDRIAIVTRQVGRFYEELWNRPDPSMVVELLHPGITFRGSLGDDCVGRDQFAGYVAAVTDALGDYRCDIVQLIADHDRAAARMTFSGVHRGRFLGVEPTGVRVAWAGAAFFTFEGDLIRDVWVLGDLDGLRAQLADAARPR
jgi:predicted ester cyclase